MLLLMVHCLLLLTFCVDLCVLSWFCGVFLDYFLVTNHLAEKERLGFDNFTLMLSFLLRVCVLVCLCSGASSLWCFHSMVKLTCLL